MNPNIAANQQRLFLEFVAALRPHVRRDSSLPRRIKEIFAKNRAIGSRDRKLYRELVYTWLRYLPWIDPILDSDPALAVKITAWLAPELKPTSHFRAALCSDWPACPDSLRDKAAILTQLLGGARPPDALSGSNPTRPEAGFHPTANAKTLRSLCRATGPDKPRPDSSPERGAFSFQPEDLLPAWFREHNPLVFQPPHLDALTSRANVWVRIQANDRNLVIDEFKTQGWAIESPDGFPDALRLPPNAEVATSDAYRRGFVEIQDLGSQLVLAHAPIVPGGRWLDACAGAGGKTLQLARLLGDKAQVDATDIRLEILDELRDRAQRARLDNIRIVGNGGPVSAPAAVIATSPQGDVATHLAPPGALRAPHQDKSAPADVIARRPQDDVAIHHSKSQRVSRDVEPPYDGVLIDAPCSGSGTWRRQPHLKWYVKPETIAAFTKTQLEILTANAPRVKPGGLLVYATCSLSLHENHDVAAAFLRSHPEYSAEKPTLSVGGVFDGLGTTLLPGTLNTDGFYVSILRRR